MCGLGKSGPSKWALLLLCQKGSTTGDGRDDGNFIFMETASAVLQNRMSSAFTKMLKNPPAVASQMRSFTTGNASSSLMNTEFRSLRHS